jgi:hypothetical protein
MTDRPPTYLDQLTQHWKSWWKMHFPLPGHIGCDLVIVRYFSSMYCTCSVYDSCLRMPPSCLAL